MTASVKLEKKSYKLEDVTKILAADERLMGEYLSSDDVRSFLQSESIELPENEIELLSKMREKMLSVVNQNMMLMMEKIAKVVAIYEPCNGTCW